MGYFPLRRADNLFLLSSRTAYRDFFHYICVCAVGPGKIKSLTEFHFRSVKDYTIFLLISVTFFVGL